jgi:hypothetical protein
VVGKRPGTSPALCHFHTAKNIDPTHPEDRIALYGYGDTVVHSVIVRHGELFSNYAGVSSTKLLPSGNLEIVVGGTEKDELEPVYAITVGAFLQHVKEQTRGK